MKKKWTEAEKKEIVERCEIASNNGGRIGLVIKAAGVSSSQLCEWRKIYGKKSKVKVPAEVVEEFESVYPDFFDDETEETETFLVSADCLDIPDEYQRDAVIVALVKSGYIVSQTVEDGHYFVNYERSIKQ